MSGIGHGVVKYLLLRPNTTVIAGVRDPANAAAKALSNLPTASGTGLIVVKIDSLSETDSQAAVQLLQSEHGIEKLDIVIANAGIAKYAGLACETPIAEMRDHFEVNAIGPLILFQATKPLLERSLLPKFVVTTSRAGSIGDMDFGQLPVTAYGSSKAAVNYIVRKIHFENPNLIAFAIHPGCVLVILKRSAPAMANVVGPDGRKQIWEMRVPQLRACLKPLSRSNEALQVFWPRLVFQLPSKLDK
jgi:norsolorinic acid ketoreductase